MSLTIPQRAGGPRSAPAQSRGAARPPRPKPRLSKSPARDGSGSHHRPRVPRDQPFGQPNARPRRQRPLTSIRMAEMETAPTSRDMLAVRGIGSTAAAARVFVASVSPPSRAVRDQRRSSSIGCSARTEGAGAAGSSPPRPWLPSGDRAFAAPPRRCAPSRTAPYRRSRRAHPRPHPCDRGRRGSVGVSSAVFPPSPEPIELPPRCDRTRLSRPRNGGMARGVHFRTNLHAPDERVPRERSALRPRRGRRSSTGG